jgi:hypothetical protein
MNISIGRGRYRRIYALTALCVAFAAAFAYHNKPRSNPNEGWKTTKELNKPFQESLITNGHEPAEFEITLVEPSKDIQISKCENNKINIKVKIKFFDQAAINSDIAPTSVTAYVRRNKTPIASKSLDPHARENLAYMYNGNIDAPKNRGDYQVVIEVSYSIYQDRTNEQIGEGLSIMRALKPFKKNLEGVTIHVGN